MLMTTILGFFLVVSLNFSTKIVAEAHRNSVRFSESLQRSGQADNRSATRPYDGKRPRHDDIFDETGDGDSQHVRSSRHFNYRDTDEWGQVYPDCNGTRQSPIDLNSSLMTRLKVPSLITWKGYRRPPRSMTIVNNGHTVELSGFWRKRFIPSISGGPLVGEYVFHRLHFHWGSRGHTGSEHTIHNRSLPLEMHVVHYKKNYGSASEAMKHEDGLAIVGILFEVSRLRNNGIITLQRRINAIKFPNTQVRIRPFPLARFQMIFRGEYASYAGSVTAPPCSEIVTWILPTTPRFLTQAQLNVFRSIKLAGGDDHNYRPTMPINDRMVYYISA